MEFLFKAFLRDGDGFVFSVGTVRAQQKQILVHY